MSNSNWNKQVAAHPSRPENHGAFATAPTAPATETELEAIRYRGTPLPRTAPPVAPQHHYTSPVAAGGHNERIQAINEAVRQNSTWVAPLRQEIGRVLVGQKNLVDRLLVGLVTNGHILLEGVPGLAKTLSLKTLASATQLRFRRLQFTPDMLPADIVGTMIYNPRDGSFHTKHGPIFSNFILADEINRAPAKVQSALLEAMQERQVTLGDETYALPQPFLVMATQNPLEQEGTYPLPEAQVDRFMLKVIVDYPNRSEERAILDAMATSEPNLSVQPVVSSQTITTPIAASFELEQHTGGVRALRCGERPRVARPRCTPRGRDSGGSRRRRFPRDDGSTGIQAARRGYRDVATNAWRLRVHP